MSRNNFELESARGSSKDNINKLGISSLFRSVKNKITNFFLPTEEDGSQMERNDKLQIRPSYINLNQHIYDAPTINAEVTRPNHRESHIDLSQRRYSVETGKTAKSFSTARKKVNPLIKIASFITNSKFNNEKQKRRNSSDSSDYLSHTNKSAFKMVDNTYKNLSIQNKKFINCNDFSEFIKDKNIIRPVPIKKDEGINFRGMSHKRERSYDAMSVDTKSSNLKRQKIEKDEKSIFSSLSNYNKMKNIQREDVSMHSINSSLMSGKKADDVSMRSRQEFTYLPKFNPSRTIDDIKREIEEKRNANRKIHEEISQRSAKRHAYPQEFDYEERKKTLLNYSKRGKPIEDFNFFNKEKETQPKKNFFQISCDDFSKDEFSMTKPSTLTITSAPKDKEENKMEKKDEIKISSEMTNNFMNKANNIPLLEKNNVNIGFTNPASNFTLLNNINKIEPNTFNLLNGSKNVVSKSDVEEKTKTETKSSLFNQTISFGKKENVSENVEDNKKTDLSVLANNTTEKKDKEVENKPLFSSFNKEGSTATFGITGGLGLGMNLTINKPSETPKEGQDIKETKPLFGLGLTEANKGQGLLNKLEEGVKTKTDTITPYSTTVTEPQPIKLPEKTETKPLFSGFGLQNKPEEISKPAAITTTSLFGEKDKSQTLKPEEKKEESKGLFSGFNLTNSSNLNTLTPQPEETKKPVTTTPLFGTGLGLGNQNNDNKPTNQGSLFPSTEQPKLNVENKSTTPGSLFNVNNLNEQTKQETKTPDNKPSGSIGSGLFGSSTSALPSISTPNLPKPNLFPSLQTEEKPAEIKPVTTATTSNMFSKPATPKFTDIPAVTNESPSSLCNATNPFLMAGINLKPQSNSLFTSPAKTNDPINNLSSHNNFLPNSQKSISQSNKSNDIFGYANQSQPAFSSIFPTANSTSNFNMDNEMAISPITSPKTLPKTDTIEPIRINNIFNTGTTFGSQTPSKFILNNLDNQPFGMNNSFYPGNTNTVFPQPGGLGNSTMQNSNNMPTGNIFGNVNQTSTMGLFGSANTTATSSNPGLKFAIGKKDTK